MTVATNAGFDSAAAAPALGLLHLVELQFLSGTLFLTNWPTSITIGAQPYQGLGHLGRVGELRESEDGQTQTLELELSQVQLTNLGVALGSVNNYQGRVAKVSVLLTDSALVPQGAPVLRFSGFMDIVKVRRDESGNYGRITLVCKTGGYNNRRNPTALRMNDTQHQIRFPGERGFELVPDLIARPQQWVSKRFQQV